MAQKFSRTQVGELKTASRNIASIQSESSPPKNRLQEPRKQKNKTVELAFSTPGDWWGLANSRVTIDTKSSRIVRVQLFENLMFSQKLYAVMVPLHTGRNLPALYVIVLLVFSALGSVMVFSGVNLKK